MSETYRLQSDTPATLIHGVTGREAEECILPAGTQYTVDLPPQPFAFFSGEPDYAIPGLIMVEGYRYQVRWTNWPVDYSASDAIASTIHGIADDDPRVTGEYDG